MLRRHHNRRWRLIGVRRDADFLPCRGNREIERKERRRETSRNLRRGYQCGIRRKERNIKRPRANTKRHGRRERSID